MLACGIHNGFRHWHLSFVQQVATTVLAAAAAVAVTALMDAAIAAVAAATAGKEQVPAGMMILSRTMTSS